MTTLKRVATKPSWMLGRANARGQALLAEAFERAGVRGYHYRLLAALDEHGPGSQAELGRQTGIDRSDVVATLDDLAGWKLARRAPDPGDRRRNVVTITDAGVARLAELEAAVADVQRRLLSPLTPAEQRTFLRLVAKLV